MEELYLVEFFIHKITFKCPPNGINNSEGKMLTANVDFGNFASFVINQNEFSEDILEYDTDNESVTSLNAEDKTQDEDRDTDYEEDEDTEDKPIVKYFDGGASLLFAHSSDGLKQSFKVFPLEVSVWTDDDTERRACVGVVKIMWDSSFLELLGRKEINALNPLVYTSDEELVSEVTGSVIGELKCSVRFTTLGKLITSRFMKGSEESKAYYFRNRDKKSSVACKLYGNKPLKIEECSGGPFAENGDIDNMVKMIETSITKSAGQPQQKRVLENMAPVFGGQMRPGVDGFQLNTCPLPSKPRPQGGGPCGNDTNENRCMIAPGNSECCCNCKYMKIPVEEFEKNAKEQNLFIVCDICGGVSYTGKTCKDEVKIVDTTPTTKKKCAAPCNTDQDEDVTRDKTIQRMLYQGLSKMLSNVRSKNHKKFCPDFKHKSNCPEGGH